MGNGTATQQENGTGLDMATTSTILVKFFFTNAAHIPAGIKRRERDRQGVENGIREAAATAGQAELAQRGRIRPGQIDTGTQVVNNLQRTQVAFLRTGLANAGYRLVDAHYFTSEKPGKTPKYVVVLAYEKPTTDSLAKIVAGETEGVKPLGLARETLDAIRQLAKTTWVSHVWQNPNGLATINLVVRQPDNEPHNALVVRDRHVVPIETRVLVEENQE